MEVGLEGLMLYLVLGIIFFIVLVYVVNPRKNKRVIIGIFKSNKPEDVELVDAMGNALADRVQPRLDSMTANLRSEMEARLSNPMEAFWDVFNSDRPEDIDKINELGGAMADRFCGFIVHLGEEFKKGNTQPLVQLVTPLMAAIEYRIESAANGAKGNLAKAIKRDQGSILEEYKQHREEVPEDYRQYTDTIAVMAHFAERMKAKREDGGKEPAGQSGTTSEPPGWR